MRINPERQCDSAALCLSLPLPDKPNKKKSWCFPNLFRSAPREHWGNTLILHKHHLQLHRKFWE